MQLAAEAGFEVSGYQLERWRREGLIPRPKQIGLGRGKGSIVLHPEGTGRQLLALLRFKQQDRRLSTVGWRLWGEGFPVTNFVREHMEPTLQEGVERLKAYLRSFEFDDEPLNETPRGLGRFSRRVGRASLPLFFRTMADAFTGGFTGDWITADDDADPIRKSFGLGPVKKKRDKTKRDKEADKRLVEQFQTMFGWVAAEASLPDILSTLQETDDEGLEQLRDEARAVWLIFLSSLRRASAPLPPYLFLVWFWARRVSPTVMGFVNPFVAQDDWLERVRRFVEQARKEGNHD